MKNSIACVLFVTFFIGLASCKDTPATDTTKRTAQSQTSAEIALQEHQDTAPVYRYVMVPNGLSLRVGNTLDSKKLAVMPFRSEVVLLEAATETPFEVEHIKGGMHKIQYEDKTGFAFSGFLSQLPLPKEEEESTEDYIAKLKERFPGVTFESKPNDPDFHEGTTDTFTLPATSWHEAFYIVSAMYQSPKTLGFPNPSGPELETIEDPAKPQEAWDSFLTVYRDNDRVKKIQYSYRAEGFGYGFGIVRESDELFKVEYLGFVD